MFGILALIAFLIFVVMSVTTGGQGLWRRFAPETLLEWGGVWAEGAYRRQPWRLVSAAFLHGSVLHLFFNMVALLSMGLNLQEQQSQTFIVLCFLVCGAAANAFSSRLRAWRA